WAGSRCSSGMTLAGELPSRLAALAGSTTGGRDPRRRPSRASSAKPNASVVSAGARAGNRALPARLPAGRALRAHQLTLHGARAPSRVSGHLDVAEAQSLQPQQSLLALGQGTELIQPRPKFGRQIGWRGRRGAERHLRRRAAILAKLIE